MDIKHISHCKTDHLMPNLNGLDNAQKSRSKNHISLKAIKALSIMRLFKTIDML